MAGRAGLLLIPALFLGLPAPSHAGAPADETVASTFTYTGLEQVFPIPANIETVDVAAIGARGGSASSGTISGGLGAHVIGEVLTEGEGSLYVNVGGNGGSIANGTSVPGGFNGGGAGGVSFFNVAGGGGGGGATDVRTISRAEAGTLESRLIVAAGGGGAGSTGGPTSCPGQTVSGGAGGIGGSAEMAGGNGGGSPNITRGAGGGGATVSNGGAAALGGTGTPLSKSGDSGQAGQQGVGGAGGPSEDNSPPGEGGGGGGGVFGGGGGGGGAVDTSGGCPQNAGGGGGGGGSNLVPDGGSSFLATAPDAVPSATVSYTYPTSEVTRAPGKKVITRRKRTEVKVAWTSSPSSERTFCSVDNRPFASCNSPLRKRFDSGRHSVVVRTESASGNADQDPPKIKFRVVRKR